MDNDGHDPAYRPCVGLMVLNDQNKVWIGSRADGKNHAEGRGSWWQMPQGGIDPGERALDAAHRELREETGIVSVKLLAELPAWQYYDLPSNLIRQSWQGRYVGQRQKWFAFRFTGSEGEINITPPDGHQIEFVSWRWAPASEVLDLIIPFKRDVYKAVLAGFADLTHRSTVS